MILSTPGWDDPRTAALYEAFCEAHDRYRVANETLVLRAAIAPDHRVLDLGAGTGRTTAVALAELGPDGTVLAVEPARAMRSAGRRSLPDPRVRWAEKPPARGEFDRVLCGAAIWTRPPLDAAFAAAAALLAPGGAFAFDLPAVQLGEPDEPGGGADPLLRELPAAIADGRAVPPAGSARLRDAAGIEAGLRHAGLDPEPWEFRVRLTQEAYRDWLKIPVLSDRLLAGVAPAERARRIDEAFARVDPDSWRWERWRGWTAWKRA